MNPITLILIVLIILALVGGPIGWYPAHYGYGGGTLLLIILLILIFWGRI
jgi:hypothetical protein